jgi:hypothetical protein
MSLEAKLAIIREAAAKRFAPDVAATMEAATQRVRESGILERVIKPGATAPDFALEDQNGRVVALSTLLASGAVVMSIFRGFW